MLSMQRRLNSYNAVGSYHQLVKVTIDAGKAAEKLGKTLMFQLAKPRQ